MATTNIFIYSELPTIIFGGFGKGIGEQISDLDWSETPKAHISGAIAFDNAADEAITLDGGKVTMSDVDRTSVVAEYGFKYKGFSTISGSLLEAL